MSKINLINGDCMEHMASIPDKHYELAIVDPPYGLGDEKLTQGGTWASKYKKGDANWDVKPSKEYWNELFRVSKEQIVWGANYFTNELKPSRGFIIWDKIAHLPTMADCEYAWLSMDRNAKIFKALRATQSDEIRLHICQKPVKLYEWLLTNYAKPNDKILDTHGGSMSIAIACHNLGFDLDCIELDPDYYQQAVKRYENHKLQQRINF